MRRIGGNCRSSQCPKLVVVPSENVSITRSSWEIQSTHEHQEFVSLNVWQGRDKMGYVHFQATWVKPWVLSKVRWFFLHAFTGSSCALQSPTRGPGSDRRAGIIWGHCNFVGSEDPITLRRFKTFVKTNGWVRITTEAFIKIGWHR